MSENHEQELEEFFDDLELSEKRYVLLIDSLKNKIDSLYDLDLPKLNFPVKKKKAVNAKEIDFAKQKKNKNKALF